MWVLFGSIIMFFHRLLVRFREREERRNIDLSGNNVIEYPFDPSLVLCPLDIISMMQDC